jgi:putative peptidoglycan lipid II flippase
VSSTAQSARGTSRTRAGTAQDAGQALAWASLIVAATYFGSRVLGALRSVAIAHAFGTSPELDAYNVGNSIPDVLFQVIAGATLASAFIPTYLHVRRHEGEDAGWRLASSVLNLVAVLTGVCAVIAFLLAPKLIPHMAPGIGRAAGRGPEIQALAVKLTRVMLGAPILFAVSGMTSGILNARRRFFLSGLAPMLYNVAIILGALAYGSVLSSRSLAWGVTLLAAMTVAGAGAHLLVQLPGLVREGMRYHPHIELRSRALREVAVLMLPRMLGLAALQVDFLVSDYFAAQMGTGTISGLAYAWSLVILPLALVGQAISTAVFPHLADQAAGEDPAAFRGTLNQALRVIIFLTIPATAGLAVLRVPVVALLLQHGSFDARSTHIVADALLFYSLGLAAQALIEILSRGFYAQRDTRTPVMLALLSMALNVGFSLLLRGPLGYRGLALSLSLAVTVEAALLYLLLRRKMGGLETGALAGSALRALAAAWVMVVALAVLMHWARGSAMLADRRGVRYLTEIALGVPLGVIAFAIVAAVSGADEMRLLLRPVLRRLGGRAARS